MFITATNCGASLPCGVLHREVLLVVAHHRDQHFFRQFQELRVEAARDRRGVFGEVDQRFEQRRVGLHAHARHLARDLVAPLLGREDHVVVAQPPLVIADGDGDLARAQAAVAATSVRRSARRPFRTARSHRPAAPRSSGWAG